MSAPRINTEALAERSTTLWLSFVRALAQPRLLNMHHAIAACQADIELLSAHQAQTTDPVVIQRAGRTIEGIQARLLKLRAIQQSSQPSTVS